MKPLYLDHAATTLCREEVWEAMRPYFLEEYGNPNCIHQMGVRPRKAIEGARATIGECLGCDADQIVITSGGSEANNLAIKGVVAASGLERKHVVTTQVEHHAVLHVCETLEREGTVNASTRGRQSVDITYLPVDRYGRVSPEQVADAVRAETVLVSIMHANNEVGTIQLLSEISRAVRARNPSIVIHSDAVQTVGHMDVNVVALGVDLLSFAAHKFYGPKGVGGLYAAPHVKLNPQILGGGQERGRRSGTENVPSIVGMGLALRLACGEMRQEIEHSRLIRDRLIAGLLDTVPEARLNGHPTQRLPNNVNVSFMGVTGEDLVLHLDKAGVFASTGSACTSGSLEPSHVLRAMGVPRALALGSLRLTLGRASRDIDVDAVVALIARKVESLRSTHYTPHGSVPARATLKCPTPTMS